MKSVLKLTLVVAVALLASACASRGGSDVPGAEVDPATAPGGPCANVRCEAACPEGMTPALKPPDCCRCVPIDSNVKDCSNVRCAACPTGQHPALVPPDCCRCVPG
ncbi:MAG TPA: hypothetical protein VF121_15125 [Thermoanaerobaculia bacterium]|nr:hypothetical protein [Thermoanaerobaculia bacterium]